MWGKNSPWPEAQGNDGAKVTDYLNNVQAIRGHAEVQTESLKVIANRLDAIYQEIKATDYAETREDVTVQTGQAVDFRANGYRYNRLVVGDNAIADTAKVVVSLGGVSWTVTLAAGVNTLDIPDGATYQGKTTSGNNFIGVLIRSNKE